MLMLKIVGSLGEGMVLILQNSVRFSSPHPVRVSTFPIARTIFCKQRYYLSITVS